MGPLGPIVEILLPIGGRKVRLSWSVLRIAATDLRVARGNTRQR